MNLAQRETLRRQLRNRDVVSGLLNCHHVGLHSLVLEKRPDGSLRRIFVATETHSLDRLMRPDGHFTLGPHNHDKSLAFDVLYGRVWNAAVIPHSLGFARLYRHSFVSALHGADFGLGDPVGTPADVTLYPLDGLEMRPSEAHTVLVPSQAAAWLVNEGPQVQVDKVIYSARPGLKLSRDGLYQEMGAADIEDTCDVILAGMCG